MWRRQRAPGTGRSTVLEQGVVLRDLFSGKDTTYLVEDHFQDGAFEYREDSQREQLPVSLPGSGPLDPTDEGL